MSVRKGRGAALALLGVRVCDTESCAHEKHCHMQFLKKCDSPQILVVGPQQAGKTAGVNFLAKFREQPSDYYHATVGVR